MVEPKQLWALDFDGVICDSVGESSQAAWKAAARVWPQLFQDAQVQQQRADVLHKMKLGRPVVETGYENIVQVRCFLEGVSVEEMLESWHTLLPQRMKQWQLDRTQLIHEFGSTRDEWMAEDLGSWLAANAIYPGVADALRAAMALHEVYIVTTKQARFTEALLRDMAQVPFPAERIFSQAESGRPKSEVLARLAAQHAGASCHFVEDKQGTLDKVCQVPELADWQLYLVDWGYNTPAERARANANPRIEVVDIAAFTALLTGQRQQS